MKKAVVYIDGTYNPDTFNFLNVIAMAYSHDCDVFSYYSHYQEIDRSDFRDVFKSFPPAGGDGTEKETDVLVYQLEQEGKIKKVRINGSILSWSGVIINTLKNAKTQGDVLEFVAKGLNEDEIKYIAKYILKTNIKNFKRL